MAARLFRLTRLAARLVAVAAGIGLVVVSVVRGWVPAYLTDGDHVFVPLAVLGLAAILHGVGRPPILAALAAAAAVFYAIDLPDSIYHTGGRGGEAALIGWPLAAIGIFLIRAPMASATWWLLIADTWMLAYLSNLRELWGAELFEGAHQFGGYVIEVCGALVLAAAIGRALAALAAAAMAPDLPVAAGGDSSQASR